ncbi:acetate--CoA ligase family protein [Cognatishimia sp. F0-27]|uniref:acetate--CoA ligase family protein n=1 Tax=Cognatishimia sp. F0-27 TaxID=2816855 RepID=UPI001D0CC87D
MRDGGVREAALRRLIAPKSVAVIGGGAWCAAVIGTCRDIGFAGPIWPVHPSRAEVAGLPAFRSVLDLPGVPDASFVGVNRDATLDVLAALAARGAGGAVAFASGFAEAGAELADGADLQAGLRAAAGDMAVLGPNCYGFLNALDGAALWPDCHGLVRVPQGVAILTQSSNIALNLTMQRRGLPIGFVGTLGNQACVDMAALGRALLDDPRVTALGLHIEGIADLRGFEALAEAARACGKAIVALKVGRSDQARAASVSHTASLAGSAAGAEALFDRLGVARVATCEGLIEALKLSHCVGRLASGRLASLSCSGGEASLMADLALSREVVFPPLEPAQQSALRAALGPRVALANPLDYHTYIWGDRAALRETFVAMMQGKGLALGLVVLDFPRPERFDAPDWHMVVEAVAEAGARAGKPIALVSSLPETMPQAVAEACMARGVLAFCGMGAAFEAIEAVARVGVPGEAAVPVWMPGVSGAPVPAVDEAGAKAVLAGFGLAVPASRRCDASGLAQAGGAVGYPLVLKALGHAHKTEAGAVRLGIADRDALHGAAKEMDAPGGFLVEAQIGGALAELLVGVTRDAAHGFVLTLGAGGVLTEILRDAVSVLLPVTAEEIREALLRLRIAPLLAGYRGQPAGDLDALVFAVMAVQDYVDAHRDAVEEVEINPLLLLRDGAVAVDALIVWREGRDDALG